MKISEMPVILGSQVSATDVVPLVDLEGVSTKLRQISIEELSVALDFVGGTLTYTPIIGAGIDDTGATDSTAAINAKLAAGGDFEFPRGTYLVDELTPVTGSTLRFREGATLKQKPNSAADARTIYIGPTVTDVTIIGLNLDGNKSNQTNVVYGVFSRGDRIRIMDFYIENVQRTSIVIDGGSTDVEIGHGKIKDSGFFGVIGGFYFNETDPITNLNVHDVTVDGTGDGGSAFGCVVNKADGVTASPGLIDATFRDLTVYRSDHDGVAAYSPNNVRVTVDNLVVNHTGFTPTVGGQGGHITHLGGTDLLIRGCKGYNISGAGIVVSNFPNSTPVTGTGAIIVDNIVYSTVLTGNGEGIVTQNYSDVQIKNNRIYRAAQYGIQVIGGFGGVGTSVSDVSVCDNHAIGCDLAGIKLDEVQRAVVNDNVTDGNGLRASDAGIRLEGVINSTCSGNMSGGNTLDGIRLVDGSSSSCLDVSLADNVLVSNGGWGIQAAGSSNRINLGINTYRSNATGEHSVIGAGSRSAIEAGRTAFSGNGSMARTDYLAAVTNTGAARTITLPNATQVVPGRPYVVKDESGGAGTNNISLATVSSQTIDGAASPVAVITTNYGRAAVYSNGANWFRCD